MSDSTQDASEFTVRLSERMAAVFAATSPPVALQGNVTGGTADEADSTATEALSSTSPSQPDAARQLCRVRVTLTGFRCVRQTWDHALNVDGWGDEVFLHAEVGELDGAGSHRSWNRRTIVFGQNADLVWPGQEVVPPQWAGRGRAGTATRWGGIRTGDAHPFPSPPWWPAGPPTTDRLPLLLFERVAPTGSMAGVLTVVPSVWEYDTGRPLDPSWGNAEARFIAGLAGKAAGGAGALAALFPVLAPLLTIGGVVAAAAALLPQALSVAKDIVGQAGDRPIGQHRRPDGQRIYDPAVVLIDLAKAASAAAVQNGFGPGVYPIRRKDTGSHIGDGEYDLFVKVSYELV